MPNFQHPLCTLRACSSKNEGKHILRVSWLIFQCLPIKHYLSDRVVLMCKHVIFCVLLGKTHHRFLLFPQLFRLHLSHLEDKKCRLLVKYLLDHPSLRTLDFSHNVIGDSGARAIGKLLTKSKLEILNLYDNNIGGPGAKAIAHALSKNTTLVSLNLCLNRLKDEGGQAICKALLNNKTLLHLQLGANGVTWLTVLSLSSMLAQNNTLKSINLSCNTLGEVREK